MVLSRMLTSLAHAMTSSRSNVTRAMPWRIIPFGDFYQLPAVHDTEEEDILFDTEAGYPFLSAAWNNFFAGSLLELTYVWLQVDVDCINMLRDRRIGVASAALNSFGNARR